MKINFNSTMNWRRARQKAMELRTSSLDECVARVISYALPYGWEIEGAKKREDYCVDCFIKINTLHSKLCKDPNRSTDITERALKCAFAWSDRQSKATSQRIELQNGGNYVLNISDDGSLDFYFVIRRPDGTQVMNGGIIFHGDHWETHT